MFRSKLKVTRKSPKNAPSKSKKKKDISSYFVAPIPKQPSQAIFSQNSQSFQQFCSAPSQSLSNTQQLITTASSNNNNNFSFGNYTGNQNINTGADKNPFNGHVNVGKRLFQSGCENSSGNDNAQPSLSQRPSNSNTFRTKLMFSQNTNNSNSQAYNASQLAFMSQSQNQFSQDYALSTPLDQPAQAVNVLRSPSPLPKKKSRHSALSPHGLDDLRRETDNLVLRSLKKQDATSNNHNDNSSQLILNENSNDGFVIKSVNNEINNVSSTPGASQDELNFGISELHNGSNLFRNKSKSNFRAAHLNSCEKENTLNRNSSSNASSRRRRALVRCSVNPFIISQSQKSRKRQRRPKMPIIDDNEEVERSRYLEEFEESEQLGSGNFCVTYKCRNRLDGKSYAIKRARKRMHGDADKRRMLREVFALSALVDVQNVVQYHTAWIEDDRLYIQLGYCNGGTVQDMVLTSNKNSNSAPSSSSKTNSNVAMGLNNVASDRSDALKSIVASNGRLTSYGALELIKQIGTGLREMHERGMVHMDVKPDNILLPEKSKNIFCLGDLGMATKRRLGRSDVLQEGDDRYMAKEFLDDAMRPRDLAPTDIFSFGVSIYHLLRGLPEPPRDEYHSIRDGNLCLPQEILPGLKDLLLAMVRPDAKKRPTARDIVQRSEILIQSMVAKDQNNNNSSVDASSSQHSDTDIVMFTGTNHSQFPSNSQGKSGTIDGRGGDMFKAATNEIIEKLRAELENERNAREKMEKMLASLTSVESNVDDDL